MQPSVLASIYAVTALSLTPISAFAAAECRVTGTPSVFGVNMTGYFAVASGETCLFPIRIPGIMHSYGISRKPAHGTIRKQNVTTYTYTAARGYIGSDTFAIYATGKGPHGSGTSIMTLNVMIQ